MPFKQVDVFTQVPFGFQVARFPEQVDLVREIFTEYAASLNVDLCFQDFAGELAGLPGKYAAPGGAVLLAVSAGQVLGCVAMRPLDAVTAEMKRLYVRPAGRGRQLGRQLAEHICHMARAAGYELIRLDTLPTMLAAKQIYVTLGFKPVAPYVFNPVKGTEFLECDLTRLGSQLV